MDGTVCGHSTAVTESGIQASSGGGGRAVDARGDEARQGAPREARQDEARPTLSGRRAARLPQKVLVIKTQYNERIFICIS